MASNNLMNHVADHLENMKRSRSGYEANLTKKINSLKRKMKDVTKCEDTAIAKEDFDEAHEKCMKICNEYRDAIPDVDIWRVEKAGAIFKCSQMLSKRSEIDGKYSQYMEECKEAGLLPFSASSTVLSSIEESIGAEPGEVKNDNETADGSKPQGQPSELVLPIGNMTSNSKREALYLKLKAQQIERQVELETRKIDLELQLLKARGEALEAELLAQDRADLLVLEQSESPDSSSNIKESTEDTKTKEIPKSDIPTISVKNEKLSDSEDISTTK